LGMRIVHIIYNVNSLVARFSRLPEMLAEGWGWRGGVWWRGAGTS
jgi:hypothetical protein